MTGWSKYKKQIIGGAVLLAVLALAFWWGGDAPSLHGWTVSGGEASVSSSESQGEKSEELPDTPVDAAPDTGEEEAPQEDEDPPEQLPAQDPQPEENKSSAPAATETPAVQPTEPEQPEEVPVTGPEEEQDEEEPLTCTISVSCATVLSHMETLTAGKESLIPADGWLMEPMTVVFYEGESVFNVLRRTCKEEKLHLEFENTPLYGSAYIEGIGNLYEFDCGEQSGWMYSVNGQFPNVGCSQYEVQDGDVICWVYTCALGADVGGQGQQRG